MGVWVGGCVEWGAARWLLAMPVAAVGQVALHGWLGAGARGCTSLAGRRRVGGGCLGGGSRGGGHACAGAGQYRRCAGRAARHGRVLAACTACTPRVSTC